LSFSRKLIHLKTVWQLLKGITLPRKSQPDLKSAFEIKYSTNAMLLQDPKSKIEKPLNRIEAERIGFDNG
jgi:hypothetical protein